MEMVTVASAAPQKRIQSARLAHMVWDPMFVFAGILATATVFGDLSVGLLATLGVAVTGCIALSFILLRKAAKRTNVDVSFSVFFEQAWVLPWPERAVSDRLKRDAMGLYSWGVCASSVGLLLGAVFTFLLGAWSE